MTPEQILALAKECGATTYTNRHMPEATALAFGPLAWETFCAQMAQAAQPADPVVGTKTWFDGEKLVTQELFASQVYKDAAAQPAEPQTNDICPRCGHPTDAPCQSDREEGSCQLTLVKPEPAQRLTDEQINKAFNLAQPYDEPMQARRMIARAIESAVRAQIKEQKG